MRTPPVNPKLIATLPIFVSTSAAAALAWLGGHPWMAMPLVLGIIAGGLVDLDNGLTGRLQNIFFTAALFLAASAAVQLSMGHGLRLMAVMTALTFALTLLGAAGLRYRTIAFGTLAVACYTVLAHTPGAPWQVNTALIVVGALLYSTCTLALHIMFPHRPVQENMARAYAALGRYFEAKAAFFDPDEADWQEHDRRLTLAQRNSAVIEAFNLCRSALFYRMRGQHLHPRTRHMLRHYFTVQDMHERISSTHVDYRELARQLQNTDLIFRIHRLLELQAQGLHDVAAALRSALPYDYSPRLARAMQGCRQSLQLYAAQHPGESVHTLQRLLDNLAGIDQQLAQLERAPASAPGDARADTHRIAAQDSGSLRQRLRSLGGHLGRHSGVFRHAVRLSLAVLGACAAVQLSHGHISHWALLTALFVCQPNYTATKSRVAQRLAGTVLGVLVGSAVPWFTPSVETKLWIIVLTTTLFFFSRNYKYSWSVFFITIQALTSLSLLGLDVHAAMPQRVFDTVIGGGIAWAAVYLVWPDWQYLTPGRAAAQSVRSNGAYLQHILGQLQHGHADDVGYRIVRRRAHEDAAALNSTVSDMSSEPAKYGARLQSGFNLLKTSYALIGYISALGAYRAHMHPQGDAAFNPGFFSTGHHIAQLLQDMDTLDTPAFQTREQAIQQQLQALKAHIGQGRQNSLLWQQLDLIARQLGPCHQLLHDSLEQAPQGQT